MSCPTGLSNTAFAFFFPPSLVQLTSLYSISIPCQTNVHPVQSLAVTACAARCHTALLVTGCIVFSASTSNCALLPE